VTGVQTCALPISDVRIEPVVFSEEEYLEVDTFGLLKEIKVNGIEIT
jgi:hypothetical protein